MFDWPAAIKKFAHACIMYCFHHSGSYGKFHGVLGK